MSIALLLSVSAASLTDPPDASVLLPAVAWAQGTLLGTLATIVAIVSVASIGFAMLSGRVDVRRGMTILIGCFILFGAPAIANGLRSAGDAIGVEYPRGEPMPPSPVIVPLPQPARSPNPNSFDPYAGASVPPR